jgi:hypothetical protein
MSLRQALPKIVCRRIASAITSVVVNVCCARDA